MEYAASATLKDSRVLTIREARGEDALALLAFTKQVGGETDNLLFGDDGVSLTETRERAFLEARRLSPSDCMLVGVVEGEAVSLCSVTAPQSARISHLGDIAVSVRKSHWGLGVGEAMMRAILDVAENQMGLHLVHLGVRADNAPALALYKKLGFVQYGRFPHFFNVRGDFYDKIEMALMLTDEGGTWPWIQEN